MVKLAELASGNRTILVPFGSQVITVTYRLGERTVEKTTAWKSDSGIVEEMMRLVVSWDVEGTNGKPVPITKKALEKVPVPVMRAVWHTIWGDTGLGEVRVSSNGG